MTRSTFRPFHWDIYEEHLDEAAFLWRRWEDALVAANFALDDVAVGPEARLLAHLDGLVLGGRRVAEDLLLPALSANDPARAFAGAWALVQAEHGTDHQDAVIDALVHAAPRVRAAVARALSLAPGADLGRLSALWPMTSATVRALLLEIVGCRDEQRAEAWIEPGLRSDEASLVKASLRLLRSAPDSATSPRIEAFLGSSDPEVRSEAITAGIRFDRPEAWEACRAAGLDAGRDCRVAFALLAGSSQKHDRAIVRARSSDSGVKRHAVWALGFAGDADAAEALLDATEDETVARIAGESLTTITGLVLSSAMIRAGRTKGPEAREVGDDDPPPEVRTEDQLLLPNPKALRSWWKGERHRYKGGVVHIQGRPRTPKTVHVAIGTAAMWRREVLSLELARVTGRPFKMDLTTWSAEQRRQWSAAAATVERP
jgi:uncharacterized protein (TIGR02270 family)